MLVWHTTLVCHFNFLNWWRFSSILYFMDNLDQAGKGNDQFSGNYFGKYHKEGTNCTLFLTEVLSISFGMCSQWHWIKIILVMAHLMTLSYIWGELFENERSSDDKLAQIFCFSWQEEKKLPYPTFHCQPWQSKFDGYQTTAEEVQGKLQFVFSISSFLKFERLVTFSWALCLIMIGFG